LLCIIFYYVALYYVALYMYYVALYYVAFSHGLLKQWCKLNLMFSLLKYQN